MHKKIIYMVVVAIAILIAIAIALSVSRNKTLNMEKLESTLLDQITDSRPLEDEEVSSFFGIDQNELEESLFITDFPFDENYSTIFNPNVLVIVIKDVDNDKYYELLNGYLNSNLNNENDENDETNENKKYETTILKESNGYLYLILSDNNEKIEKEINELFS